MKTEEEKITGEKLIERIYSPLHSAHSMRNTLVGLFREFPAAHSLGLRFAERNIRTRYRQSIFGIFWAFVPPLMSAAMWIVLNSYHIVKFNSVGPSYPVFVITGMMYWTMFTTSITTPMQIVQSNRSLLVKINFPRESLLVNAFYEILFNSLIGFVIVVICIPVFKISLGWHVLLFVPLMFGIIILGMSIGLIILPFALLFRDIQFVLPSVLQLCMYLTPVIYAKPVYTGYAKILKYNPVTPLLSISRDSILNVPGTTPFWEAGLVIGTGIVVLFFGIFLMQKTMQILIERMGT